jgi:hypothetical protein
MKLISAKQRPHIAKVGSSTFAKLDIKAASWVHLTDQTNVYILKQE